MLLPPPLKSGDKIAIISTARKIMPDEIAFAVQNIRNWGYDPVVGKTIGLEYHQFAGTDEQRLNELQQMIDDTSIKAIILARGGYGTVRIIDNLKLDKLKQNPKWIIGYSDITILHSHLFRNLELVSLHASMPINFATNTSAALDSISDVLKGQLPDYKISSHPLNISGSAKGILTGGNLSILYNINGTSSDVDSNGKVLFLEDLDEYLYHIDRMMMNLKRSGKLENLAGLIVGGMTDMNDNSVAYGFSAEEIILEHVKEYGYPVIINFPAGHISDNRALLMGATVELNSAPDECSVSFSGIN